MTKIWPDDYSDEELIDEAAHEVVEGVYEGASMEYCVEHQSEWLDGLGVDHDEDDIERRARERLPDDWDPYGDTRIWEVFGNGE